MSSKHLPADLKPFYEKFASVAYAQDDSQVFDDLLAYIIDIFSFDNPWQPRGHYKLPEAELRRQFFDLFGEIVRLMEQKIRDDGQWYDPFGTLYEWGMSSQARRANAGQFFTPANIVDLMVACTVTEDITGRGHTVGDPACGSGRTLIACHAKHPGNYCSGVDIDRTCAMMTVCNFILHGVNGEVLWCDSLFPDKTFYDAWRVYPRPDLNGIAEVSHMKLEETHYYKTLLAQKAKTEAAALMEKVASPQPSQLLLF